MAKKQIENKRSDSKGQSLEQRRRLKQIGSTSNSNAIRKPLRLWPGVAGVVLQWLTWFVVPVIYPSAGSICLLAGLGGGLLLLIWWLFFSRARWVERLGAIVFIGLALIGTARIVDKSIAGGMMRMMPFIYGIPLMGLALVIWAAVCGRLNERPRRALLVAAILLGCVPLALVRTDGMTGDSTAQFAWRWSETAEQRLLASTLEKTGASRADLRSTSESLLVPFGDWPGFRGSNRDSIVRNTRLNTDWSASPPVRLWDQPVGPGWSSFAVEGDRFFTQEQRGEEEIVSCYTVSSGEPVWKHSDTTRFWESNAGAGPRATPTFHAGRIYAFGGTGILNALEARNGEVLWTRKVASEMGRKVPGWGFAGSPLIVNDLVVVAAGGWLAGLDLATGKPRWSGPAKGWGYSSPQLVKIGGVDHVLLLNGEGAISVSPGDGKVLWEYAWPSDGIVQPGVTAEGDVLVGSGSGMPGSGTGLRRLAVTHEASGWTVAERWRSIGLKPYYNDFVVHKGFAFGFDGSVLACIDLQNGHRKWKGGRYGHGQMALLADQDLLLILSEEGEVALVRANPDSFTELGKFSAIKGKTWNHPVLVGDILLVRNSQEMAAFRLGK